MSYRFKLIGGREIVANKREIDFFITTKLENNFYWRHNRMLKKTEVDGFFWREITDIKILRKISYYILFYAENLCFTSYLYVKVTEGNKRAKEYMENHKQLLEFLRKLHKINENETSIEKLYRNIHVMIFEALKYAVDPF